ncbi:MAG: hypothetical protein ACR2M0_03685 [Chloroflexia bacterium]
MNLYYPTTQPVIAPNIMVRKRRVLPVQGDVLVGSGARLDPDDVVARANILGTPITVDVADALGVRPKALKLPPGERVAEGDILAERRMVLGKRLQARSPISGTYNGYDPATGLASVTPDAVNLEARAWIRGIVAEEIPYRGVVIETPAALVRGIVGIGGEQHGALQVAVGGPTSELLPDQITAVLSHAVVLGGGTITAAALQRAVENNVRAIIVGSIPDAELRAFLGYPNGLHIWSAEQPPPLTLIVVDGFGRLPMNARAWELLTSFNGQEVAVDGTTCLRDGLARPEVIVPLSGAKDTAPYETTAPPLAVRSLVRLIAPPYLGRIARVTALSQGRQALPSGLTAHAAAIQLPDKTTVWVPITNLEVLE